MLSADVNLAPVGTVPVSYRVYESLQQGSVPVTILDQSAKTFCPYKGTRADLGNRSNNIGWEVPGTDRELGKLAQQLDTITSEEVRGMRRAVMALRDSHFTPAGSMAQLKRWFVDPSPMGSDVRCR